jgi:uncharacterized protein (TIGR02246 family)
MKPMIATLLLAFASSAFAATADRSADEAAIKARYDEFTKAWAKDDAKGMAALWLPEGDIINPFGRLAKGRPEVEKLFSDEHSTFLKNTNWVASNLRTEFLTPEIAVVTADVMLTGAKGPDGKTIDIPKHILTNVLVKKAGTWSVAACRVTIPAPPPPPPAPAPPAK